MGGEDVAVNNEIEFLKENYDVDSLLIENTINTNTAQKISFLSLSNYETNQKLERKIKEIHPDIVYIHNTWFSGMLGVFNVLKKYENIQIILKVHNFRYDCINAVHYRDNGICHDCTTSSRYPGIKNKCYESSVTKSVALTHYSKRYFSILKNSNLKILALTNFHKKYMVNLGIDAQKIYVFENPILNIREHSTETKKPKTLIYGGRISKEKGVGEIIHSFLMSGLKNYEFEIYGNGPELEVLKQRYISVNRIKFKGFIENKKMIEKIKTSQAVLLGTKMYEGQPTLITEAILHKTLVLSPSLGGMAEFFDDDTFLYTSGDYLDLINKLNTIVNKKLVNKVVNNNFEYLNNKLSNINLNQKFQEIVND
jgi:glycosyltransferase involved in cell wall biosynthesis